MSYRLDTEDLIVLQEVSDNFDYRSDRDQFGRRDSWFIMREKPYLGDCEDFALTVLYNLQRRSLFRMLMSLTFLQSKIHFCKAPNGTPHATLRYKSWYTDNWQREWLTKPEYIKKGYEFHRIHFLVGNVILRLIRGKMKWNMFGSD